jgi:prepilin peptidase CpaA
LVALLLLKTLMASGEVAWLGHLGAGLLVLVLGLGLYAAGGMGAGDVKLLAATSAWFGLPLLLPHLLLTSLAGVVLMLVLLALRRWLPAPAGGAGRPLAALEPGRRIPYGVAIAFSAVVLMSGSG